MSFLEILAREGISEPAKIEIFLS